MWQLITDVTHAIEAFLWVYLSKIGQNKKESEDETAEKDVNRATRK